MTDLERYKANELLVQNKFVQQSPFNYSNREFLTRGIGQVDRGIVRSDVAPVFLGHKSSDQKNEILRVLQQENRERGLTNK